MKKIRILCMLLSLLIFAYAFCGCTKSEPVTNISEIKLNSQQKKEISKKSEKHLKENNFSGTAIVTLKDDEVFVDSFGYTDGTKKSKNQITTQYQIGSLTKTFTGVAILQLVAQDKLSLTDTLDNFFKGKNYLKDITVQHLLEMRSGFSSYTLDILNDKPYYNKINKYIGTDPKHKTIKKLVREIILKKGVESATGNFNYSHSDYYLLGLIIEEVTGMEYSEYVTENIIKPLGLTNTTFVSNELDAVGYRVDLQSWRTNIQHPFYNNMYVLYSSLGILSDVNDVNKLYKAVLSNEALGKYKDELSCLNTILASSSDYSCGFYVKNHCIYSEGNTNMHSSNSYINTETQEITILLSNYSDTAKVETLTKDVYNFTNAKINGIIAENIQ